jgi:hypothetical protein
MPANDPMAYLTQGIQGLLGSQSGPAVPKSPQLGLPEAPLGSPDTAAFDLATGVPSAMSGNPLDVLLAALTLIPGGRAVGTAATGAKSLGKEALELIPGGLAKEGAEAAPAAASQAAASAGAKMSQQAAEQTAQQQKVVRQKVQADNELVKQKAQQQDIIQRQKKLEESFGPLASVAPSDILSSLPVKRSDPATWNEAQRLAVDRLRGFITMQERGWKGEVPPETAAMLREGKKLLLQYGLKPGGKK